MAIRYRTEGFVLKKENKSEADQLITFYTSDFGKIKILGRAIRKIKSKLRCGIELFSFSRIEFIRGKSYNTLTDAVKVKELQFSQKPEKISAFFKISELLDTLIKGQEKDREIWKLLNKTVEKIDSLGFISLDCDLFYYYFFWNLVSTLGYGIDLYRCSFCQEELAPGRIYFSVSKGLICSSCFQRDKKSKKISSEAVKIIRLFRKNDWETLKKIRIKDCYIKELEAISKSYLESLI
ncbi:MAG TPA: DNA repair protein RecO [Candidatus Parcubacteria bacterium]|nr:DNA repair protein RecO [Candidatus Parcubacteria bacterium]